MSTGKRCLKKRCHHPKRTMGGCCCGNCCGGFGCPQCCDSCCGCGCGCGCANVVFPVCFGAQCKCPKGKKEKPPKECKFTCCWPCCCTCKQPKFKFTPLKAKPCCCCPQGKRRGGSKKRLHDLKYFSRNYKVKK